MTCTCCEGTGLHPNPPSIGGLTYVCPRCNGAGLQPVVTQNLTIGYWTCCQRDAHIPLFEPCPTCKRPMTAVAE